MVDVVSSNCCNCPAVGPAYSLTTLWKLRKSDGSIVWERTLPPTTYTNIDPLQDLTFGCGCWVDTANDRIVQVGGDQTTAVDRLVVRMWSGLTNPQVVWDREISGVDGFEECYCRIFGDYVWIVTTDGDAITLNISDGTISTQTTISDPQYYFYNGRIWLEEGSSANTIQLGPFAEYDATWTQTQATSETIISAYLSGSTYGVIYSDASTPTLATISKSDLATTNDIETLPNIVSGISVNTAASELVAYDGSTFAIVTPASSAPLHSWGVNSSGTVLWSQLYRVGINELGNAQGRDGASQVANGSIVYQDAKFSLSTGADQNGNSVGAGGARILTDGTYVFQAANLLKIFAWDISDGTLLWEFINGGGNFRDIWDDDDHVYVSGACYFINYQL